MVHTDSDGGLDGILTSIRTASAALGALAGENLGHAPFPPDGASGLDEEGELEHVVASIGTISVRLQALADRDPRTLAAPAESASSHGPGTETVGERLKALSDEISDCGALLMAFVRDAQGADPHYRDKIVAPLERLLDNIRTLVCRISVIGQVKAGKSCLANAFAGHPDLLPTSVNPWTGVVTELHFGDPGGRAAGADFSFFGDAEWRLLVEGGGLLRELTQQYVPGFDEDLLREQIDAIRARVEKRLGADFSVLLGQNHHFESCDAALLQKYVCAGSEDDGTAFAESDAGKFSDVTRLAQVYLPKGCFEFPAIVMDTPGTNDPLMVRDEITRRSLLSADLHVVVLTAQQTLTMADLALLRILNGLRKDRVIVFINRVDQLNDPVPEIKAIEANVEAWMKREFPGGAIPVRSGSAWWAECAQQPDDSALDFLITPQFVAVAAAMGAASESDFARWGERSDANSEAIRAAAKACSGVPQLKAAVSSMMLRGPLAAFLRQAIGVLRTLAAFVEASTGAKIANAERAAEAARRTGPPRHAGGEAWRGRAAGLRSLAASIKRIIIAVGEELEAEGREAKAQLEAALRRAVADFAAAETSRLREASAKRAVASWECQSHPLRREMEYVLAMAYGAARLRVLAVQRSAGARLRGLVADHGLAAEVAIGEGPLADLFPPPPAAALGKTVALDLSSRWWSQWWKRGGTVEQNCADLNRLIEAEFSPIAEDIARASEAGFRRHITEVVTLFLTQCADFVQALHNDYESFARTGVPAPAAAPAPDEAGEEIGQLAERLAVCRDIQDRLARLAEAFPAPAANWLPS